MDFSGYTMSELDALFASYGQTMDAGEVAELLRVERTTVYSMLKRGALPGYKVAGGWVVVTAELKAHLLANRNPYKEQR